MSSITGAGVERDDESGRFTSTNDTRERVYEALPPGEPVIASEIADKIGEPRTTVNYHLNKLANNNRVRKKRFHEKRVVWVKPIDGRRVADDGDEDEAADDTDAPTPE
jgi:predicted transcriptional regulator